MRYTIIACLVLSLVGSTAVFGDAPGAGRQAEMKLELPDGGSVPYLLYLPKEYGSKEGKWPLMLFLHGRGESYGPLSLVKKWGPPMMIDQGQSLPYVLVSPQCPEKDRWNSAEQQAALVRLLDHIIGSYQVDTDRIYLTGLSMGGYGSWRLAADHPEKFAAVIPVCGAGTPEDGEKLKGLPIWVFHGTEDRAVPFERSVEMVEAIKKAGGAKVKFTSLEHVGHNSWSAAYATPEIYQWLDQQAASKNR